MNRLDNEFVEIGDEVFDIINGSGRVVDSTSSTIVVRFTNNRKMSFTQDGYYNGTRRIFWHNPIIIAPEKDAASWEALTISIAGLVNYVKSTK